MNLSATNKPFNNKGQSFVELALVLPVVLALALGGIEYTNLYVMSLKAASISRETSNMAFRQCRGLEANLIQACLDSVVTEIAKTLPHILPKFNGTHTVHVDDADDGGCDDGCSTGHDIQKKNGALILSAWHVGSSSPNDIADSALIPSSYAGSSEPLDNYADAILMASSKLGDTTRTSKVPPASEGFSAYFNSGATVAENTKIANAFFYQKGGYMFVTEVFYYYNPISGFVKSLTTGAGITVVPDEIYQTGFF